MKSLALLLFFCVICVSLQNESDKEYESKKQECTNANQRILKVKSYLTCIK